MKKPLNSLSIRGDLSDDKSARNTSAGFINAKPFEVLNSLISVLVLKNDADSDGITGRKVRGGSLQAA